MSCGEGFWRWPSGRGRRVSAEGCNGRANAGHRQKIRRLEGFRESGPTDVGFQDGDFVSDFEDQPGKGNSGARNGLMPPNSPGHTHGRFGNLIRHVDPTQNAKINYFFRKFGWS